jgi:putative acetyltransferase
MEIRPARTQDTRSIVELHADTVRRVNSRDYSPSQIDGWLGDPERRLARTEAMIREGRYYVAEEDGRVVGFGHFHDSEITSLYVDAELHGRGIGSALLARLEEEAVRAGAFELEAKSTLTALGFYLASGYEQIERLRVGSVGLDVVRMRKRLAPERQQIPKRSNPDATV